MQPFAIATRDELWSRGTLVESRLSEGEARQKGEAIVASDTRHPALREQCGAAIEGLRAIARQLVDARVRLIASARTVGEGDGSITMEEATLTIAVHGISVVTTPAHAFADAELLRELVRTAPDSRHERSLPYVWRNGSAALLLHEAIGHVAEYDQKRGSLPAWLEVRDEPPFPVDDTGEPTLAVDLLHEAPRCRRRESFRDVPLPRMTTLVARQHDAPFELPERRIEIHLAAGGAYDPLTGMVTLEIAIADRVERGRVTRLQPFTIRQRQEEVVASVQGATGEPIRYPGVVCSREGQELLVGSYAPLMITR